MKNFIRLTDYTASDIYDIFRIADEVLQGKYNDILKGKSVVLFFSSSSIRTRVTFEKGIYLLGGHDNRQAQGYGCVGKNGEVFKSSGY